jgi:hypothetical protein
LSTLRGEDWAGLASGEAEDGDAGWLVWLTAAIAASAMIVEIIKKGRKILFMLDLKCAPARFRNLSLVGCKAAGGKVPLF